jgi:methylase of polypeptide subunit release factors
MNHEVEVSNLMFNKASEEKIDFKKYDISVDLEEELSTDQKTVLKYSLDLTSNPKNSVINISGNAILNGEQEEIEEMLKQDNENTPQVVSLIYQELFPLMYIISKNMKIPSPAHTISHNNVTEHTESNLDHQDQIEPQTINENNSSNLEQNENKTDNENTEDSPEQAKEPET